MARLVRLGFTLDLFSTVFLDVEIFEQLQNKQLCPIPRVNSVYLVVLVARQEVLAYFTSHMSHCFPDYPLGPNPSE